MEPQKSDDPYDNNSSEKPIDKPDLRSIEGLGGNKSKPSTGGSKASSAKSSSPEALRAREEVAGGAAGGSSATSDENQIGGGYKDQDVSRFNRIMGIALRGKARRRTLIGGGIGAGLVTVIVVFFLSLLPLKIIGMVENLQHRFFASSENAVQNETEILLSNYIKKYITPALSICKGSTIDKNCNPVVGTGTNPVLGLYRAWGQAKLENTLAEKYGIEFKKVGTNYYLKSPNMPTSGSDFTKDGEDITRFVDGKDKKLYRGNLFQQVSRSEVRQSVRVAMSQETKWKQVMYRFKVGRMLEHKYGIKRCVFFCKTQDKLADWKDAKTNKLKANAAKVLLSERVLGPRAQNLSLILQCVLAGDACKPNKKVDNGGVNGEGRTQFNRDLQNQLDNLAQKYGQQTVDQIINDSKVILKDGFTRYAVDKVISEVVSKFTSNDATTEAASQAAADAIPLVNALNIAAKTIGTVKSAGPKIKSMAYAANAASMVSLYMLYRTHADEIKSGHVDSALVGSMVDTLGPGQHTDSDGSTSGASAEGSPLYDSLIGSGSSSSTALLNNLLPAKAYATTQYLCDNGKPVPAGKLICPEEDLRKENALSGISAAFDTPPLSVLGTAADFWNSSVGHVASWVGNLLGGLISNFPGVKQLSDTVAKVIRPVFEAIVQYLVPSPISDNMSGGRTFDMMAGGADVAGNDFAHHGLGGRVLSGPEAASITNEQQQEAQQSFKRSSLLAKIFSKDSQFSLVNKLATAMPTNLGATFASIGSSLLHNPFSTILNGFSSILGQGHASAAATTDMCSSGGPFGVTCYGYTDGDLPQDPEAYWDQNCQNPKSLENWNNNTYTNSATGQAENKTTDPCLLIQATVGSAGGYFSDSTLTPDDLADSSTGTTGNLPSDISNKNVYVIGDSLTDGMKTTGNLAQQLTSAGWNPSQIEDTVGINVANSIPRLQADSGNVWSAGTVIVELGTNNCSLSGGSPSCMSAAAFEDQITSFVGAIKKINPTARIYWVNIYTTKGSVYQSINQALSSKASALGYKVIDWASEVTNNPAKYSFDSQLGVHQTGGSGYTSMAGFVVGALGAK